METVVRNVRDLDQTDRSLLERVLGHQLREGQQLVIQVISMAADQQQTVQPPETRPTHDQSPPWANIYEGLSDAEVDDLDQAIRQRADLTRRFE